MAENNESPTIDNVSQNVLTNSLRKAAICLRCNKRPLMTTSLDAETQEWRNFENSRHLAKLHARIVALCDSQRPSFCTTLYVWCANSSLTIRLPLLGVMNWSHRIWLTTVYWSRLWPADVTWDRRTPGSWSFGEHELLLAPEISRSSALSSGTRYLQICESRHCLRRRLP